MIINRLNPTTYSNFSIFLINPNKKISHSYKKYLKKFSIKKVYSYIAPIYPPTKIVDKKLVDQINKTKPRFILINLGGTKQEILGDYLNNRLKNNTMKKLIIFLITLVFRN